MCYNILVLTSNMKKRNIFYIILLLVIVLLFVVYSQMDKDGYKKEIVDFEECLNNGGAVMESYPRQCKWGEEVFVEEIEKKSIGIMEIEAYLDLEDDFNWQLESEDNKRVCSANIIERDDESSIYYALSRCSEFSVNGNELEEVKGIFLPVKLTYPLEFSFFDPENFSHEVSDNGSFKDEDLKKIFSDNVISKLNNLKDEFSLDLNYKLVDKAKEAFKNYDLEVPNSFKQDCQEKSDCYLPFSYAIKSSCLYEARCEDNKCQIICPR